MSIAGLQTRANMLYRIAAVVAFIFFLGHTLGAIVHAPYFNPAASAVRSSMESVVFPCNGATCTWFGFYLGFGIIVSVFLIFAAFLLWFLAGLPEATRILMRPVTIALLFAFVILTVVSKEYFFPVPFGLSFLISTILAAIVVRFS